MNPALSIQSENFVNLGKGLVGSWIFVLDESATDEEYCLYGG